MWYMSNFSSNALIFSRRSILEFPNDCGWKPCDQTQFYVSQKHVKFISEKKREKVNFKMKADQD